jgi:hypothetical protein
VDSDVMVSGRGNMKCVFGRVQMWERRKPWVKAGEPRGVGCSTGVRELGARGRYKWVPQQI